MVGILKKLFKKEKITKKYKNGDIYVGEIKNDKPHGQGTYTWPKGEKYVGGFKDDKKHGEGTWTYKDQKYVGGWKEDKEHGVGTFTSNEIKFIGKLKDGERLQGTMTWFSGEFAGNKYVGNYKGDEQHGQGTHTWTDGSKYVGEWENGEQCEGTYTSNEIKFVGKFKGGEMIQGTHTWISGESAGDKYVGEFKDGEMHGQGTYTWAEGHKYVGEWENGEQSEGTSTSVDGKVEKITKTLKRNELAIFEELRLKLPTNARAPEHYPREYSLHKLNLFCERNKYDAPVSYWKKKHGKIFQVDEYGQLILSGDKRYKKNVPKGSSLKKYNSKILVTVNKYKIPVTWWTKDKNGELLQLNIKEEEGGIEFKIKSWLRNKAIDAVGLEIRSMKNKAYEYPKDELMRMIEKEENKMIKKGGWKALRVAALSTLGLSWLPFL